MVHTPRRLWRQRSHSSDRGASSPCSPTSSSPPLRSVWSRRIACSRPTALALRTAWRCRRRRRRSRRSQRRGWICSFGWASVAWRGRWTLTSSGRARAPGATFSVPLPTSGSRRSATRCTCASRPCRARIRAVRLGSRRTSSRGSGLPLGRRRRVRSRRPSLGRSSPPTSGARAPCAVRWRARPSRAGVVRACAMPSGCSSGWPRCPAARTRHVTRSARRSSSV